MTMDFYPPRAERPGRGIAMSLIALPIGVVGYWLTSWSIIATAVFMVFLGLMQVLLYRAGSRSRVIAIGRTRLLLIGGITMVLTVVGGSLLSVAYILAASGYTGSTSLAVIATTISAEPTDALLAGVVGVVAGVASLVYFVRRFARAAGAAG